MRPRIDYPVRMETYQMSYAERTPLLQSQDPLEKYRVRYFNQAEALEGLNLTGGPCVAFCLLWIAHHKKYRPSGKKESTATRMDWIASPSAVRAASELAADLEANYKPHNRERLLSEFSGPYIPAKSDFELMIIGWRHKITYRSLVRTTHRAHHVANMVTSVHRYCIIFLNDDAGGSTDHAICCYKSSGKIFGFFEHFYIFDPNSGEYVIGGSATEFETFFALFLAEYKRRLGATYSSYDVCAIDDIEYMPA
jgi:hypothetical protein